MKYHFHMLSLLFLLVVMLLSACSTTQPTSITDTAATAIQGETFIITDMLGRQVAVPTAVQRVVAIGPGALRLYVYAGNLDYLVGIEQMDSGETKGKPYMLANPQLTSLAVIGQGGPNNSPDPEKLLNVAPDVIFSTYALDASMAARLQTQTNIPVVVINYGGFGVTSIFGEEIQNSITLIGEVIGESAKAASVNDFIQQARQDLENRTKDIPEGDKPTVYVGALGSKGTHGIESTQGEYALLEVIHATNVVDETKKAGAIMIDKEKLLEWDPDFLFIDWGGYPTVMEDFQKNPAFYGSLSAMKNGNIYAQLPYNNYSTNIDTAIADAYFLGKIIYPDAFKEIDPAQKADEIYQGLLGKPLYAQMVKDFGDFSPLKLE